MITEDTQDLAPEDTGGEGISLSKRKGRQAFRKVTRELSDEDLTNPAVQRLLLDELDRLEIEVGDLKRLRDKFHESDKRVAVLEEQQRLNVAFEILSSSCLALGAAIVGYSRFLWDSSPTGWFALILGSLLIIAGIAAKVVKR